MISKILPPLLFSSICFLLFSCVGNSLNEKNDVNSFRTKVLDYSYSRNWLVFDASNSKDFDVIFIHPTTFFNLDEAMNDDLTNKAVNQQKMISLQRQASVFSEQCNLFAPYYKQMSMACLFLPVDSQKKYFENAYADVEAAMNYYIDSLNQNKPYFIAGHSQGSDMLKEYLYRNSNKLDPNLLVAIYTIGYTFTQDTIDAIGIALSEYPEQVPALITWNTIGDGGQSPVVNNGACCVNPLTWSTDTSYVDSRKNLGANVQFGNDSIALSNRWVNHFSGARINEEGALVIDNLPESLLNQLDNSMGFNVFHSYDYDFFYQNIVENIKVRAQSFHSEHKANKMVVNDTVGWITME